MVTDIYGGIEFRHPWYGRDFYEGEPWVKALDLWPLLEDGGLAGAYPAYAYLFGVRNGYAVDPIAPGRGLPDDVSKQLRGELQPGIDDGELVASWVLWSELADLDLGGPFGPYVAWIDGTDGGARHSAMLLPSGWGRADVEYAGPPPNLAELATDQPYTWTHRLTTYTVRKLVLGDYFGPATPWGHVFAVMRALGERFGDDHVRLVAAFD